MELHPSTRWSLPMIRALTAAAVAAVAAVSLSSPVHAAPGDGWVKLSPNPAVVRPDRSTWVSVSASFKTDRPVKPRILAEMRTATDQDGIEHVYLLDPDGDGVWTGRVRFSSGDGGALGRWRVEVLARDADTDELLEGPTGSFRLQGWTRTRAKAGAKSTRRGGPVLVSGSVEAFTSFGAFAGSERRKVGVYFRKAGGKRWVRAGSARTDAYGRYAAVVRPKKSGAWRVRFAGTGEHLPSASKMLQVRVR